MHLFDAAFDWEAQQLAQKAVVLFTLLALHNSTHNILCLYDKMDAA
jgi:hypothetical protein